MHRLIKKQQQRNSKKKKTKWLETHTSTLQKQAQIHQI